MYWLLGVAVVGAVAWLSSEENNARNDYYDKKTRLAKETQTRQNELNALRKNRALARDFYQHIELHHASVQTANACHELYADHKKLVAIISHRIHQLREHIIELKQQRDSLPYNHERKSVCKQLRQVREHFEMAKTQRQQLIDEKAALLTQLRTINEQTRSLKQHIGQHCGEKGRVWYAKMERGRLA